ncbi:pyrroline-5-carboxylate reductase [Entomobacter blattae]|uniref:Pyrroline-5-carboxylate reductase n=1 Tax=Entomobacter blattae TaxID=2762277 RepID=A0A7H1NQ84_9PROT|nr:pyrroline-5-carboxylate reductase [Entomobacter blattae]QNT77944.1 Pyrroline-5-carboxylate reductase [Entomobacter blattae]
MQNPLPSLMLIGCGKMGGALFSRWVENALPPSAVVDHHKEELTQKFSSTQHIFSASVKEIPDHFTPQMIILAVKPAKAMEALTSLPNRFKNSPVISILAGKTVAYLRAGLTPTTPIIRVMPNTPSLIGAGMSVAYAEANISDPIKAACAALFECAGEFAWVEHEDLMHAVTALSGSGPAYIFYLAELLLTIAKNYKLPQPLANRLVTQTLYGSSLLLKTSALTPEELRQQVTSPQGTTAAALSVLMQPSAWPETLERALQAACERSRELNQ